MKQEDKELLFIDLSARLNYGVIVNYNEGRYDFRRWKIDTLHALSYSQDGTLIDTDSDGWISYEEYKGCGMSTGSRQLHLGEHLPYLRPMSSMTDEERKEYKHLVAFSGSPNGATNFVDWLNKKMFDYRGLIEKGLAIAVDEKNNPYKYEKRF